MIGIDNCDYRFCHLQIKVVRQSLPHQHHRQSVARPIVAKQWNHNPRVGGASPSSATISLVKISDYINALWPVTTSI